MKLLVLGGTLFLGRHVVSAAMTRGHEVTTFTRGVTPVMPVRGVEALHGDRNESLDILRQGHWDAVIDTSGYLPAQARSAAGALRDLVGRYCFVSTGSVYASHPSAGAAEDDATHAPPSQGDASSYGPLKAACEREVIAAFGGAALIVRPGVLGGPFDPTGRLAYWVSRIAEGGSVLAPGDPDHAVQLLDARDLAAWLIHALEGSLCGVYNASGAALTMGELLDVCTIVTGSDARLVWANDSFLLAAGVTPWVDLPLWLPRDVPGPLLDSRKAIAAGLVRRDIADTIRDVMHDTSPLTTVEHGPPRARAMRRARERELLLHLTHLQASHD